MRSALLVHHHHHPPADIDNRQQRHAHNNDNKRRRTKETTKLRKYILLKYSKGGENWSHRDDNDGDYFEYQALLMLSDSEDYDGGDYVAKRSSDDGKISRTYSPKLNAGDSTN